MEPVGWFAIVMVVGLVAAVWYLSFPKCSNPTCKRRAFYYPHNVPLCKQHDEEWQQTNYA